MNGRELNCHSRSGEAVESVSQLLVSLVNSSVDGPVALMMALGGSRSRAMSSSRTLRLVSAPPATLELHYSFTLRAFRDAPDHATATRASTDIPRLARVARLALPVTSPHSNHTLGQTNVGRHATRIVM